MDNKAAFKQKLNSKLEEFKADFDKLKARTKGAYAEGQLDVEKENKAKELETKIEEVRQQLAKLEARSEDNWEDLKTEIEETWDDLKGRLSALQKK